jgi:2,4-dienoyl-CoA reductase-like NADH-dependent reductase (Old Yellow Enzyme family)
MSRSLQSLFRPFRLHGVDLPNRIVMAPMTRAFSPGGVPGENVAAYYQRRAAGGVGLIVTEGVYIPHPAAGFDPSVPHLYGDDALLGWRNVVNHVHAAHGRIFAQLWHVGQQVTGPQPQPGQSPVGPSMPLAEIEAIIGGFGEAAANAQAAGFDGVEIHGAHGYLIDQFLWERTNHRTDAYGGSLLERTRFAADIITEIRRRVGPQFPVVLRYSQFKVSDYAAHLGQNPAELDRLLAPLVDSGIDALHASARRFWEPAFPGSELTLAGWTKKLTGLPTIAVGSVTLGTDMATSFRTDASSGTEGIDKLLDCLERDEFDLIAIGRSLIVNPLWAKIVEAGDVDQLKPFERSVLKTLE